MDCANCALKIERALRRTAGVRDVQVSLAAERATVVFDPAVTSAGVLARTVEALGYTVRALPDRHAPPRLPEIASGVLVVGVALAVLAGLAAERLGWADVASRWVPWPVAVAAVLAGGLPIFRKVALALRARTVTPHALMTLGIAGALAIGEAGAAAVIVFFMRLADALDAYTAGRARAAIRELVALRPMDARVERDGAEVVVPADAVARGEVVLVKPGERIPVDGTVIGGRAAVDQAPVTGESVPVEREPGQPVLAATLALDGMLRVRAEHVGPDSTFGRIIRLVEEAEIRKSRAQRFADRVTAYYIPIVAAAAAAAWLLGGSPQAAVAVLVVSCSCGIALATPVAVLAAVGRAAREGVLIKGGAALEALARADVLLLDKTGTLTAGQPRLTGVHPADGRTADQVLALAARAERFSEHPLAAAIVAAAGTPPIAGADAVVDVSPGRGVVLREARGQIAVGSRRLLDEVGVPVPERLEALGRTLEAEGHTVVLVAEDGATVGLLALADAPRPEVPAALAALRRLGFRQISMLTGDNPRAAAAVAGALAVDYQAALLPEGKIDHVRRLQREGRTVAMVGDGINDAPALAAADVGIAVGAATGAALEAADVAVVPENWMLVPHVVRLGRRAFGVIRQNLIGAVTYNVVGITLAASGLLPPVLAAAAQVVPDLLILLNSSRLLGGGAPDRA
ncbi:MAG: cation-translocating P-type ATPase [Armatimonadota bacterium]|nr:cation-translocating P-type ATPase [Armatimonadota bacterium]MDR7421104.1 cation-translocating P-type ATPase [Armatimonadota bacterium]MDR7453237.1 cation-translocating P-type ATPase [Armatimonadota bacterium]MDR7455853.1 cation-translocating P-type ATPase [Armatimonadota bacterium]MDR7497094.1 cation-translocating P-type ATPase [Armatimonadota bacterium]